MQRRFKITASGKATHRKSSRGHLLSHKGAKRKRNLRNGGLVCGAEAKLLIDHLRPGA
jgi:large subunit ribosomal protein L35